MIAAHSSLHYSIGITIGIIICLPFIIQKWKNGKPLFGILLFQLILSNFLGIVSILPPLLVKTGIPKHFLSHPLANLFLFYPVINNFFKGGTYIGPAVIIILSVLQYFMVIAAINRAIRKKKYIIIE